MSTRMSRLAACAAIIFLVLSLLLLLLLLLPTLRKCFHGSTGGESRRSILTSSPSAVQNYQRDGAADLAHFWNKVSYIGSGNGSTGGDGYAVSSPDAAISQRDAELVHYWYQFLGSAEGSSSRLEAQKELIDVLSHRLHVEKSIELVGNILFGSEKGVQVLKAHRPAGQPLVDDWDCLKTMVRIFETYCGSARTCDITGALANICNAGISVDKMRAACSQACKEFPSNPWSSLHSGYSA